MNKLLIHDTKDINSLINSYYIALIPLLIFGFYKNGLLLYFNNLINLKYIFIPLYFYLISIIVGFIIAKIFKESPKLNILISLIITSSISLNTNIYMYIIVLFISFLIAKYIWYKYKFNYEALIRLMIILSLLFNSYSYMNILESLNKFNYNLSDIFIGHGIGGIASTSLLLCLISLIILSLNKFYKKEVVYSSLVSFIILSLGKIFLLMDLDYLKVFLNGHIYFALIFMGGSLITSPHHKSGMIIYGIIIGIFTFFLSLILPFDGVYLVIFITSLLIPLINKITNRKYLQKIKNMV